MLEDIIAKPTVNDFITFDIKEVAPIAVAKKYTGIGASLIVKRIFGIRFAACLYTSCCFVACQQGLAPLLTQASPHPPLNALAFEAGDLLDEVKNTKTPFSVDFGVGDVIVPKQEKRKIPTQLPDF